LDYIELIKNRRSIRDFEDREVSLDLVKEIIKESCLAPSSGNRQEWRFAIINNREWIKRLSDESKSNILKEIEANPGNYMSRYKEALKNEKFNVFYNAPSLILILGPRDNHSLEIDCSLMACYIMFAATSRGLGTCWIGLGNYILDPGVLKELGITDDLRIVAPVILGYPKRIPRASERKEPQIVGVINRK
jgi:nitroreductase